LGHENSGLEIFSDLSSALAHCLAAGHYQPLADGDALHVARTKGSSVVGVRRHLKKAGDGPFSGAL